VFLPELRDRHQLNFMVAVFGIGYSGDAIVGSPDMDMQKSSIAASTDRVFAPRLQISLPQKSFPV
jgi:hypothetical protein